MLQQDVADIAVAFQQAVVDTLLIKCRRAVGQTGIAHLEMAGGVSANLVLRERLQKDLKAEVYYAPDALCVDNGAMIAFAGVLRLLSGEQAPLAIHTRPSWPMTELSPITAGTHITAATSSKLRVVEMRRYGLDLGNVVQGEPEAWE